MKFISASSYSLCHGACVYIYIYTVYFTTTIYKNMLSHVYIYIILYSYIFVYGSCFTIVLLLGGNDVNVHTVGMRCL